MLHHYIYPAVFFEDESEYKVLIPDLNLTTEGNTIEEAFLYAKDFLRAYCTYALKFDMEVEIPTKFEVVRDKNPNKITLLIDSLIDDKKLK